MHLQLQKYDTIDEFNVDSKAEYIAYGQVQYRLIHAIQARMRIQLISHGDAITPCIHGVTRRSTKTTDRTGGLRSSAWRRTDDTEPDWSW